jgi:hypothetical protein
MARTPVHVQAAYDPEAAVWYVEDSDLHGVNAWAPTVDELLRKLPGVVLDLLEAEGRTDGGEVPIEFVVRSSTSARWSSAP